MGLFDGQYLTSYLMEILMFSLFLTIYELFTNQIKCKEFDLENEGQSQGEEKVDTHHSTGNVRFHIGDYFNILATRQHVLRKKDTTHSEKQICLETMQIIYVCLLDIDRGHVTEIELEPAATVTVQSQATLLLHLLQGVYIP